MSPSPPSEWQYVAAAYLVVFVAVLAWVADHRREARSGCSGSSASSVEKAPRPWLRLLFWPALLGYGEAAFAYASARTSRAATWGVRIGWLAQTALLVAQAARADGFPWSSWAGSLNLFVWLVVGAYLIWGCRPRFRLLGLAVMPLAAVLFLVARIGGGTQRGREVGLRKRLPRPPRRLRARGVRRLHAGRRAGRRSTSGRSGG